MRKTWRRIAALLVLCLLSLPLSGLAATLKKGSRGEAVKEVQTWLIDLGYLNDTADGAFGKKTEAAVKAFQKTIGVKQNGRLTDEQQTRLLVLWGDVTGIMEGDGLSDEELAEIHPAGCSRKGDDPGQVEYCWRHLDAGRLTQILMLPGLPDTAVGMAAERAVDLWTEGMNALFDEWAETNPDAADKQRDIFEEALAEAEPDLNDALGPGSPAAQRELAFWLEGNCVDRCFDLHTAEGNSD